MRSIRSMRSFRSPHLSRQACDVPLTVLEPCWYTGTIATSHYLPRLKSGFFERRDYHGESTGPSYSPGCVGGIVLPLVGRRPHPALHAPSRRLRRTHRDDPGDQLEWVACPGGFRRCGPCAIFPAMLCNPWLNRSPGVDILRVCRTRRRRDGNRTAMAGHHGVRLFSTGGVFRWPGAQPDGSS